jgi:tRNA C32,U32 (ribose-2'-O)-methylase TrmJ
MTEQSNSNTNNTSGEGNQGFVAQAQERVTGATTGLVDSIKANPKTAAAVAVGAAAAVAGVVYRDKITEAVGQARGGSESKGGKSNA